MFRALGHEGEILHVEHEYGHEIAKQFAMDDTLGEKGSAGNKVLKKAIETAKTLRSLPSSSSRANMSNKRNAPRTPMKSEPRSYSDRKGSAPGGPRKPSDPSEVTCY
jgi:hypothetical protein